MNNTLFVASRSGDPERGGWSPVGRVDFEDGIYRFVYTKGARTAEGFSAFSGMEELNAVYTSDELFPIFANRLMPSSRPEYEAFLRWSGFDASSPPDPIALLGVTEGIRQTDQIEVFPCPVRDEMGCYLNKFFLHGLRYMPEPARARIQLLKDGEELLPMLDVGNQFDRMAVALRAKEAERLMIGYVPRYLAHDVWQLFQSCGTEYVRIFVHRVNRDAPLQQRLLCRMKACWPENFQPCSGEGFQPIPEGILVPTA